MRASDLKLVTGAGFLGIDFKVSGLVNMEIETDIPGKFSAYNALTAIAICIRFWRKRGEHQKGAFGRKGEGQN